VVRRTLSRSLALAGLALGGWAAACSDRGLVEPRFSHPTGTIVGLDPTKRLPTNREFGGNSAMAEIANQVGAQSLGPDDTLTRAVAEWRAKQSIVSGPSASKMWEGVESYGGDYYVWSNGESYAPAHKQARIYNMVARATRLSIESPVDITVTFNFDGHHASNSAHWTLTNSSGQELRNRAEGPFGSQTDPFLGLTIFGARGWAASASEQDLGCDVRVKGGTRAKAWFGGRWDESGISIGITPAGPGGSISLTKGTSGELETSKTIETYFTCPPSDSNGGYGGDGGDCTACQQWFLPLDEDTYVEWWECGPAAPSECEGDAT
jgi:hypothetical protein